MRKLLLVAVAILCGAGAQSALAKKPPKPPAKGSATTTLSTSSFRVVYGLTALLSGTVSTKQAGESVTILSEPFGTSGFTKLASVTTGTGGAWSSGVKPTIHTSYEAQVKGNTSAAVTVGVSPLVRLNALSGGRFSTKVMAARSFAGKIVQLQRRSSLGQWVTVQRRTLNASSAATFHPSVPRGSSTLRAALSVNQAGPGYLAGFSRTISFRH